MFSLIQSFFNFVVISLALIGTGASAQSVPGVAPEMQRLLEQCAPNVHPETMAALLSAESGGQRFAIADAGPKNLPWEKRKALVQSFYFATQAEAVTKARELIASGHTVSLGPAQLNDRQLPRLGMSIEDAFEPCRNLRGGDRILTECYQAAEKKYGRTPRALSAALSCYNSGDFERGARDGYVARVARQVGKPLALRTGNERATNKGQPIMLAQAVPAPWWKAASRGGRPGGEFTMSAKAFAVSE